MLAKRAGLLLFVAACAVYIVGLGRIPLVGPDEPRYAQVAREMFARGDFVTPTLGGLPWFEKPALTYWVMMLSYGAFGVSEWSARVGSAVAGLLTIVLAGWLARRVEATAGAQMRGFGLATTATTATTAGIIVFSRGASFDVFVTATLTLALACFFAAEIERDARVRLWLLAGFYAGVGASLLAKGLVGVVIPAGVVGLYFLMRRRWPPVWKLGVWWGTLLALGVAATWYAPVISRHGWRFVDEFFIQHHFARYVSNRYNHPQPFYYYLPVALALALPWTVFLLEGIRSAARVSWRAEETTVKLRLFALAWLAVPVLFFSLSGSKLPGYILPALPGAAMLAGERLARYARGEGGVRAMSVTGAVMLLFAVAGAAYAVGVNPVKPECAVMVALPVALSGALALVCPGKRALCATALVCAIFAAVSLATVCGLKQIGERESMSALLKRAQERGYATTPVLQLHDIERTSEFYAAGRITYDRQGQPHKLEGPGEVLDATREKGGVALVIVPVEYTGQLTGFPPLEAEVIGDNGWLALVAVKTK